jgi:2-amino-4-hydroxy-6-hydroxymethyldihydropteridine diphosphokinase
MTRVYIGIGSNIGAQQNVLFALRLLAKKTQIVAISTIYLTEPVCPDCVPDEPDYLNGVVEIETDLSPVELKNDVLRGIEEELGRVRTDDKYAPRTIDMDILLYGDKVIREDGFNIPDPLISERAFLAIPLWELNPDLVLPGSRMPIKNLAAKHAGHTMKPMLEYTFELKKEIEDGSQEG